MYSTFKIIKYDCLPFNNEALKTIGSLQGVFGAEIDRITGVVTVNHTDEISKQQILETLKSLGWVLTSENNEYDSNEPSIW